MVSLCAGLVTVDKESDIIRLAHYTTQEYFMKTKDKWFLDSHGKISKSYIDCLSFDAFEEDSCQSNEEIKLILQPYPLNNYATRN